MNIKHQIGINSQIYQDALEIRRRVFVDEQAVPEDLEIDQNDPIADNYVGYLDETAATTARTIAAPDHGWHVQRVATRINFRHRHLASQLLQQIIADATDQQIAYLILDAQLAAIPFYQQLGFQLTSREQFLDAGIMHREMKLDLTHATK